MEIESLDILVFYLDRGQHRGKSPVISNLFEAFHAGFLSRNHDRLPDGSAVCQLGQLGLLRTCFRRLGRL